MKQNPTIQEYACVLCIDRKTQLVTAASANTGDFCERSATEILGTSVQELLPENGWDAIIACTDDECGHSVLYLGEHSAWTIQGLSVRLYAAGTTVIAEVNRPEKWRIPGGQNTALLELTEGVSQSRNNQELLDFLCQGIRRWLGFDRVMAYRFDNEYNGLVVAEACKKGMVSLKSVHFWERDVPADAREMQLREVVHYTYDVNQRQVGFLGEISAEVDRLIEERLSCRKGHKVVDIYLRESGNSTQLGISLIVRGQLWGNVYAHSRKPHRIDHGIYVFLRVMARLAGSYIGFQSAMTAQEISRHNQQIREKLQGALLSASSLAEGLIGGEVTLLDIIPDTTGACTLIEGELKYVGKVPEEEQLHQLIEWLEYREMEEPVYYSDHLVGDYPAAADFIESGAGIMAVATLNTHKEWMIWFRPEEIQTVIYGSPPDESEGNFGKRFRKHRGILKAYSYPWNVEDVTTAVALQQFIQDTVVQRYKEVRQVNERLQQAYEEMEAFSYTVSHDLRAPLRGIDGFAEILMEDYGEEISQDGKELISTIQENAARMNDFITDILELSRVGRSKMIINPVPVGELVRQVVSEMKRSGLNTAMVDVGEELPTVQADERHLRMVLHNLISNAIKYSGGSTPAKIKIDWEQRPGIPQPILTVTDNGIGIDPAHRERVFDMFTRLVPGTEFEGTGIGLAIVKRIVSRLGGKVWIEDAPEGGAKFLFYTAPS